MNPKTSEEGVTAYVASYIGWLIRKLAYNVSLGSKQLFIVRDE